MAHVLVRPERCQRTRTSTQPQRWGKTAQWLLIAWGWLGPSHRTVTSRAGGLVPTQPRRRWSVLPGAGTQGRWTRLACAARSPSPGPAPHVLLPGRRPRPWGIALGRLVLSGPRTRGLVSGDRGDQRGGVGPPGLSRGVRWSSWGVGSLCRSCVACRDLEAQPQTTEQAAADCAQPRSRLWRGDRQDSGTTVPGQEAGDPGPGPAGRPFPCGLLPSVPGPARACRGPRVAAVCDGTGTGPRGGCRLCQAGRPGRGSPGERLR